jgi:hypothetical protein
MADCSGFFIAFNKNISLTPTDVKYLRAARTAIIKKIREYLNTGDNFPGVKFVGQGSFTMGTIIKPTAGEFDIDIGVYLSGYSNWQADWPKTETVSSWLLKALENHTSVPLINKRSCVRVTYKPKGNQEVAYHVDLPVYIDYFNLVNDKYTRIGITGKTQWDKKTDPVGLTKWFFEKCKINAQDSKQLIRLVKYIKAWKEFKKDSMEFPSGIALTVLMANNYVPNLRDDFSFKETIRQAYNNLNGFWGINGITKPVENNNDLMEKLKDEEKKKFLFEFEKLVDDAILAIKEEDPINALSLWKAHFDSRFE